MLRESALTGTPGEIVERLAEYRDQGLTYPVLTNAGIYFDLVKGGIASSSMVKLVRTLKKL